MGKCLEVALFTWCRIKKWGLGSDSDSCKDIRLWPTLVGGIHELPLPKMAENRINPQKCEFCPGFKFGHLALHGP